MGNYYKFTPTKNTNLAWRYFSPIIGNDIGTAGLVAGLYLRSGCDPYTGYENYIGHDELELKDFAYDRKGFGMGKWKHWVRKQSLFNYCGKAREPIYDIHSQMSFIMDEFSGTSYGPVLNGLMNATSVTEAAYLVYDGYLDIRKRANDMREVCASLAMEIYTTYSEDNKPLVPVKYVEANKEDVAVLEPKRRLFSFLRKKVGTMIKGALYNYITMSDDGREYMIRFGQEFGYVNTEDVHIVTKLEAIK